MNMKKLDWGGTSLMPLLDPSLTTLTSSIANSESLSNSQLRYYGKLIPKFHFIISPCKISAFIIHEDSSTAHVKTWLKKSDLIGKLDSTHKVSMLISKDWLISSLILILLSSSVGPYWFYMSKWWEAKAVVPYRETWSCLQNSRSPEFEALALNILYPKINY